MSNTASSSATLENTPLLHLLVSIADRQMSGSVSFETPSGSAGAVVFDRGIPRKSSAEVPCCRLSDILIEFGWLDAHSAAETYAMALEQKALHGRVLVDCRLVDEAGLARVLHHQLLRKLNWVAAQSPQTRLGLHEDVDLLAVVPADMSDGSALADLWGLAKLHVDEHNKRRVIDRVANRQIQLHAKSRPELFGFNATEMLLVDRLRHVRMDVAALLYQLELPRQTAEALVYLLLLTRHIDIGDGRIPVGVTPELRSAPPPATSGEYPAALRHAIASTATVVADQRSPIAVEQLRHDLQQLAALHTSVDFYSLLGVARDASPAAIRTAFVTLTRRYHPDRLPRELQDQRNSATQLIARFMTAYRELADPEARAQYDKSIEPISSNSRRVRVSRRSQCEEALRRAEQMLNRNRIDLAEAECVRALELNAANPQCIALHAWIRSLKPDSHCELEAILEKLSDALDIDPMNVQTRYYRAEILKRLDRIEAAVGEWRLIIDLSPDHIDAQRELRLWEMRRSSRPPKQSRSGMHRQTSLIPPALGLLGKLFRGSR